MEPFHIRRGFTLVELMVVLAIIVTITSIALTSQSSFNKTLILANTAYDIALTLRSAETYGISSRASGAAVNVGYGVHLASGDINANSFILFADTSGGASCVGQRPDCKPGDNVYTSGGSGDALVQTYRLNNGIFIHNFCAYSGATGLCENPSGSLSGGLASLDIVFDRPNPDASIIANGTSYTGACLALSSAQGGFRYISVASSGQITASATSCP